MSARRPPLLVIEIPLEGDVRMFLCAMTEEDLRRLRGWLRRSSEVRHLGELILDALDVLDREEGEAA